MPIDEAHDEEKQTRQLLGKQSQKPLSEKSLTCPKSVTLGLFYPNPKKNLIKLHHRSSNENFWSIIGNCERGTVEYLNNGCSIL